jgi:hypothetical protein
LAKLAANQAFLLGRQGKGVQVPTDKSTQTEREAFFEAIGRPKTPEDYKIEVPKGLEDRYAAPEVKEALGAMHSLGLTQEQVKGVMALDAKRVQTFEAAQAAAAQKQHDDAMAALKTEWGEAFESKTHLMKLAIAEYVPTEELQRLQEKFGNDADLIRVLSRVGSTLTEGKMPNPESHQTGALTPAEHLSRAKELMATPGYANGQMPDATRDRIQKEIDAHYRAAGQAKV